MSESNNIGTIPFAVFCGLDVGKGEHHATALNTEGGRLYDRPLPNEEAALREVFTTLTEVGRVLVVVDQPARSEPCPWPWPARSARRSPTCPA